ncbi:hypothetical protein [Microbacterium sp.]|uniref:hypothetical protein n=1 Tax=Microbacterium sp. TaxID=51671 RepID=UPI0026084C38|nr:hypothetical protein [Microbacterium sp.]
MTRRIPVTAFAALTTALLLTGCAAGEEPATPPDPTPVETEAAAEPVEETPAPADEETADPTCETIISASTVEALTDLGWTYEQKEFRFGEEIIDGGLECVWGDYTVASDHVQVFGWAPLDADASADAQQKLIGSGWLRADADGHTYITEDPAYAMATDEEGFGMTYEFGDGWVKLADAKQSLILIEWP